MINFYIGPEDENEDETTNEPLPDWDWETITEADLDF